MRSYAVPAAVPVRTVAVNKGRPRVYCGAVPMTTRSAKIIAASCSEANRYRRTTRVLWLTFRVILVHRAAGGVKNWLNPFTRNTLSYWLPTPFSQSKNRRKLLSSMNELNKLICSIGVEGCHKNQPVQLDRFVRLPHLPAALESRNK